MTESRDQQEADKAPELPEPPKAPEQAGEPETIDGAEPLASEAGETPPAEERLRRGTRLSPAVRAGIPALALMLLLAIASFIPGIDLTASGSDACIAMAVCTSTK